MEVSVRREREPHVYLIKTSRRFSKKGHNCQRKKDFLPINMILEREFTQGRSLFIYEDTTPTIMSIDTLHRGIERCSLRPQTVASGASKLLSCSIIHLSIIHYTCILLTTVIM